MFHLGKAVSAETLQAECIVFEALMISCTGYHLAASFCVLTLIFEVATCFPF